MKWKKTTIIEEAVEKKLRALKISQRGFCLVIGLDIATISKAFNNLLILSEETANKVKKGIKDLENNPELCKKLQEITGRSGTGRSLISREEMNLRDKDIVRLRKEGLTLLEIGEKHNITKERVRQILSKAEFESLRKLR